MAGGILVDVSEVLKLAADMNTAADQLLGAVRAPVDQAAHNLRTQMRADMADSAHFRQVAPAITYDLRAGRVSVDAEVGPVTAGGTVGDLAHFAYFGGAHGGGGTVRDPIDAAVEQTPAFERAMADAVQGMLR